MCMCMCVYVWKHATIFVQQFSTTYHRNVSQWEWKIDRNRRANRYIKSLWIDRRIISIGIGSQDGSKFRIGGKYSISKRVDEFQTGDRLKAVESRYITILSHSFRRSHDFVVTSQSIRSTIVSRNATTRRRRRSIPDENSS